MLDQNHQDQIVANMNISWIAQQFQAGLMDIVYEQLRPFILLKPKIYQDGKLQILKDY
jgi:hypothetical protein